MPAMPRTSNKAREIAYNLLGCPPCLEEDNARVEQPKGKKSKKAVEPVSSSEFKLDSTLGSHIP